MAHPEQTDFVRGVSYLFPAHFHKARVLEVGSRNVNGSVREFFSGCDYTGVDCVPGPDVDVVCPAHEFRPPAGPLFDTVISCEAFEHDPHLEKTIPHVLSLLRPGGLFVATWAAPGREEHGTSRTEGDYSPDPEFYDPTLTVEKIAALCDPYLSLFQCWYGRDGLDGCVYGFRKAV